MDADSFSSLSLPFVEGLYADWLADPASVDEGWRRWFEGLDGRPSPGRAPRGPSFEPPRLFGRAANGRAPAELGGREARVALIQDRADQLIRGYRVRGHLVARIDPLGRPRPEQPELDPGFYGFTEADLDREVSAETFHGERIETLRSVLERMRNTYCRSIGAQFMHIDDLGIKRWLQDRMESTENRVELPRERQVRILTKLTDAVIFEVFLQKKYLGAKSFSLEGAESLIPLLDETVEVAGAQGIEEIVLGMAPPSR